MSAETTTTPTTIEHLDWALPCQTVFDSCGGTNPAAYLAVSRTCPECVFAICSPCVSRKVSQGARRWCCSHGVVWGAGAWLDTVTLHPLGGTP